MPLLAAFCIWTRVRTFVAGSSPCFSFRLGIGVEPIGLHRSRLIITVDHRLSQGSSGLRHSVCLALAISLLGCAVCASPDQSETIITLGSGFNYPIGVAVDASGNVFVADTGNDTVKEILVEGIFRDGFDSF